MATKRQTREPYDPVRVIHDSFNERAQYFWTPTTDNQWSRPGRYRKWLKHLAEKILKDYEKQKLADEDTERRKRAAEIFERVAKDKVLLALEKAFEERVKQIRDWYEQQHAKEKSS